MIKNKTLFKVKCLLVSLMMMISMSLMVFAVPGDYEKLNDFNYVDNCCEYEYNFETEEFNNDMLFIENAVSFEDFIAEYGEDFVFCTDLGDGNDSRLRSGTLFCSPSTNHLALVYWHNTNNGHPHFCRSGCHFEYWNIYACTRKNTSSLCDGYFRVYSHTVYLDCN